MTRGNGKKPSPKPISGLVDKIFRSLGMTERLHGSMVIKHWPEVVGAAVSKQSKAVRYRDGVLTVAVPDAAWRQELSFEIDSYLREINKLPYGRMVKQIRLVGSEKGK